ncbi:MAG: hypothetical protein ACLU99_14735 [Alphaproteobacteria bacterium]
MIQAIILIGDTTERLNIKTKSNQRSVRLIGKRGLVNRIICGTKIDSGTLVAGTTNVYQTPLSSFSAADRFQLFQHEVFDEGTLIPDNGTRPHVTTWGNVPLAMAQKCNAVLRRSWMP